MVVITPARDPMDCENGPLVRKMFIYHPVVFRVHVNLQGIKTRVVRRVMELGGFGETTRFICRRVIRLKLKIDSTASSPEWNGLWLLVGPSTPAIIARGYLILC